MSIGRTGRGHKQDVAPGSAARQTPKFWEDFVWALAYAVAVHGDHQGRIGNGLGFGHGQSRLDGRCWGRRFRWSCALPFALATASGLLPAAFLACLGGAINLTGTPRPPALGGFSTSGTAITSLRPRRHEPAFAIFKQAPAAARVPTAKAAWLTRRQRGDTQMGPREGKLPSGQAAGRWYFPPPLCADHVDAVRPGSGGRHMPAYLQHFTRARGCSGMA